MIQRHVQVLNLSFAKPPVEAMAGPTTSRESRRFRFLKVCEYVEAERRLARERLSVAVEFLVRAGKRSRKSADDVDGVADQSPTTAAKSAGSGMRD